MRFHCNIIVDLYTVEAFSDDLACVGDQDEGFFVIFTDKVTKPYGLHTVEGREDDVFILP